MTGRGVVPGTLLGAARAGARSSGRGGRAAQRHPVAVGEHRDRGHAAAAQPFRGPARRRRRHDHRHAARRGQPRRGRAAAALGDRLRAGALGRGGGGAGRGDDRRASRRGGAGGAGAVPPAAPRRDRSAEGRRRGLAGACSRGSTGCSAIGALVEARALIDAAGPETPELFRRWFDIGILLDDAAEPCAALRQNPSLSPTLPARVFCLARGGDWNAAEITLTLGQEVGSIGDEQQALLARFLDPALFEEEPEPPVPAPLTALDFLMREAVGMPRPPGPLPLAFLHMDLDEHVPMRTRAEAAERLALSGAIAAPALFAAYRSGEPAASGGVWDRARAVQALDAALAGGRGRRAGARRRRRGACGARAAGERWPRPMARRLAALDPATARRRAAAGARRAAAAGRRGRGRGAVLPGRRPTNGWPRCWRSPGKARRRRPGPGTAPRRRWPGSPRPRRRTIARPSSLRRWPKGVRARPCSAALALVRAGPAVDPPALRAALLTLRLAGQEEAARAIALETLLAGPVG